jgi:hypothetical protein
MKPFSFGENFWSQGLERLPEEVEEGKYSGPHWGRILNYFW